MARRTFRRVRPMVKMNIPEELYEKVDKFRRDYMQMHGKYLNSTKAYRYVATRIKVKPPRRPLICL